MRNTNSMTSKEIFTSNSVIITLCQAWQNIQTYTSPEIISMLISYQRQVIYKPFSVNNKINNRAYPLP